MTLLQEALDFANEFSVDKHNLIANSGKFEREPLYVPYFWFFTMESAQDDIVYDEYENRYDTFLIDNETIEAFKNTSWLGNDPYPELRDHIGQNVYLAECNEGFVTILFNDPT